LRVRLARGVTLRQNVLEKLLLTVVLCAAALLAAAAVRGLARAAFRGPTWNRARFWIAQFTHLFVLAAIITIITRLWIFGTTELGPILGYFAAGLTIALQRVVTSFSAYLIILRGKTFTVGDRIMIGGVRGDVVALGYMQTTVMEMGQALGETGDEPSMWVHARQYSGRIVRVTNDKIFDTPIYNYTRDFRFMWDELMLPIRYGDDYQAVERILLDVAQRHTASVIRESQEQLSVVRAKYFMTEEPSVDPRVYVMLTDNWVQLSLRFVVRSTGAREIKDAMNREILAAMADAKIAVASGTYAVVEMPTVRVQQVN
jgi:small-conductance mechanosensitive channel